MEEVAATPGFSLDRGVFRAGILRNSLKNSLFAGNLAGDRCDHHCVASHLILLV
jgi:hypothetical protein